MRPRIYDAIIEDVFMQHYVHKGQASPRELRHATVSYFYKSLSYKQDILLKSKSAIGDKIQLSVDPNNSEKVEQYYPTKELIVAMIIEAIGISLIVISIIILNKYSF